MGHPLTTALPPNARQAFGLEKDGRTMLLQVLFRLAAQAYGAMREFFVTDPVYPFIR
jgi:hypothetical protein